jgi:hypothetical protein
MWSSWVKRKGTTQVMCIAKLKDGPKSVTTGMFVTRRPRGAKPQVKGTQGPAGWPNPLAGRPHFESVQTETWWLLSYVSV